MPDGWLRGRIIDKMMPGSSGPRHGSLARATALTAGLYALVLVVGPVLHHDLACHLKSRTHCTACVISITAPGEQGSTGLIGADHRASSSLGLDRDRSVTLGSRSPLVGRSPPPA
jgi:hypothetical protein